MLFFLLYQLCLFCFIGRLSVPAGKLRWLWTCLKNFVKVVCYHANHNLEIWKSNHQGHDFDLLTLKFKLRCVSTGCNVTMVTYYIPKTAICNECTFFYVWLLPLLWKTILIHQSKVLKMLETVASHRATFVIQISCDKQNI